MPKATMRTPRGQVATDESFGPMSAYQRLIGQADVWESWDGGVAESKTIADMPAPYAVNALHKLSRWQERLFAGSTAKQYEEARTKMYESLLVDALIQQALGEFYAGTWLPPQQAPHLDDVVAAGQSAALVDDLQEALLEVSITGAVELEANARESIGARARILYRILAEGITTTTTEAS
jgi:hypothetical protein